MSNSVKIATIPCDLEYQKITTHEECYIELFQNHFQYKVEFYAKEPINMEDINMGWKEDPVYHNYCLEVEKSAINCIEIYLSQVKRWVICFSIPGLTPELKIYFRMKSKAQELFDQLHKWKFG